MRIKCLFAGAARFVSRRPPFPSFTGGLLRIPFEGTAYLRAFALLLATAAYWPLMARADTYPVSRSYTVGTMDQGRTATVYRFGINCAEAFRAAAGLDLALCGR